MKLNEVKYDYNQNNIQQKVGTHLLKHNKFMLDSGKRMFGLWLKTTVSYLKQNYRATTNSRHI